MTVGPEPAPALLATIDAVAPAGDRSRDTPLVRLAIDGDRAAFEALVGVRLDQAFRTAVAILGREADASDAVQETFIAAWKQLPRLRDPERFDAWIARILVNECRMALRRRGRVREIHMPDDVHRFAQAADGSSGVADVELVGRAFDQLAADDRVLLVLHHLEERPIREIAQTIGIPEGTVKWRLHRARRALEKALEVESR